MYIICSLHFHFSPSKSLFTLDPSMWPSYIYLKWQMFQSTAAFSCIPIPITKSLIFIHTAIMVCVVVNILGHDETGQGDDLWKWSDLFIWSRFLFDAKNGFAIKNQKPHCFVAREIVNICNYVLKRTSEKYGQAVKGQKWWRDGNCGEILKFKNVKLMIYIWCSI